VVERQVVAEGVVTLTLAAADEDVLAPVEPGAHLDLDLPGDLTRQYSICATTSEGHWQIAILREPHSRGGSRYLHDSVLPGTVLRARGPRNHFALLPASEYLFIAGGIGITPLLPMIEEAERNGATWRLLYGGRSRSSMAFADRFAAVGDRVAVRPQDEFGLLELRAAFEQTGSDCQIYCCGPESLLNAVEELGAHAVPRKVHVERFSPKSVTSSEPDHDFEVRFNRTGCTRRVGPDQSIVTVAREAGIDVQTSCTEGICGTCETVVIAGEVDHRDSVLTPEEQAENTVMLICVSRARSRQLVLDC
jgi:ferredoxin-NADP reductase